MFVILDFQNLDPEKVRKEIEEVKNTNPSMANMFQSMLNKYEEQKGLPLTKIVEPIKIIIIDAKTGKKLQPKE